MSEQPLLDDARKALLERLVRGEVRLGAASAVATATKPSPPSPQEGATTASPTLITDQEHRLSLRVIQEGGSSSPFFYLHGYWNGNAFYCFPLARMLGADRPFYLMETYRWDDLAEPPTLPQMAAEYIALMKQIRPHGPYLLGGFCNGATIAYEIARQLRAGGDDVRVLVTIDAWSPGYHREFCRAIQAIARLIRASRACELTTFLRARHLFKWFHPSRHHRQLDHDNWAAIDPRLLTLWPSPEALRKDYVGVFLWLSALYDPDFYPGKVNMIWNREDPSYRDLWFHLNQRQDDVVTSVITEGDHITLRTDFLQELAARIHAILQREEATSLDIGEKIERNKKG